MSSHVRWLRWLWHRLPRPLRVLIAGGAATACDTIVLMITCWGLGVPPGFAAIAGCLTGGAVNFAINRRWIFAATGASWLPQLARYGVIVVGGGALVSGAVVAALAAAGVPLLVAKASAVMIALVTWTYPMSARVVFGASRQAAGPAFAGEAGGDPEPFVIVR